MTRMGLSGQAAPNAGIAHNVDSAIVVRILVVREIFFTTPPIKRVVVLLENSDNAIHGQPVICMQLFIRRIKDTFGKCIGVHMANKATIKPQQLADDIGLVNPPPEVLEQLPFATATASKHKLALMKFQLTPADEPAVVFTVERWGDK